ncbi:MAG TPA: bifunctional diaminohydroxyphosphoribosylaminopyrimidine deaminase/5-amino-6-(5-phosphoribosylamino)uracil reductase RibD [Gemmatimonadaceae bacterium]|jgi:diaminohydroxyphosphoribosylaminopyrimidine deaminase/5-amino-6-(5-phosphoribosylamino)uracil reductase|nr:bifunctional diaminohydroxyphosphoribosylaminopyrimidine deaminase/5-amino-6-(5-phosphoribosylamino)uracil reductase RibD [Gemmatimonadaceae bacterium]
MTDDRAYMRQALALARRGWGRTAPNPLVGAVLVRDGEVVGEGHHAMYGGDHAEVAALRVAGDRARGATAYVTLEPCAHHGKTPPCADALIAAGVRRVVAATADPNPTAAGGLARLRDAGIETVLGVEEAGARELNAAFFHAFRSDRPWVTLKFAVSIDGAIAGRDGSGWLTGRASQREVHHLRAGNDAVAVGIGTVLADDPLLTIRDGVVPRVPPVRVVFDRSARTPPASRLVQTARETPVVIVAERPDPVRAAALVQAGVEIVTASSIEEALGVLGARGIRSLLVEGGARLGGALLTAALVDRLVIFQAPCVLGAGALGAFACAPARTPGDAPRLPIVERRALDDDLMTVYACSPA